MTWIIHHRSATLPLINGYTLTVNAIPNHGTGPTQWRARALGQPVDGVFGSREEAMDAAVDTARKRLAAIDAALWRLP